MKKIATLFSLLIVIVGLNAQTAIAKYYAIDGSTWMSKYDRDRKERLLWDKIDINLRSALVSGKLGDVKGKEYHDTFQKLFQLCKESFETIRLADMGKEILQNAEFRFFLSQNGVKARIGVSRSGEPFNLEEYASCFDSVLREYSFNAGIVAELSNGGGDEYNLEFVVDDFAERMELVMDKIKREVLAMEYKENTIQQLVPRYKAAKQAEMKAQQKQNRRKN